MACAPLFSIIIPFKAPCDFLRECLEHIGLLHERRFEVILLPDAPVDAVGEGLDRPGVTVIPTGPVSPAVKRDLGAKAARGRYLAFIDDDAYPEPLWLTAALLAFERDPGVAAVGGPAQTPASDPFWARASGAMFLSSFSGGFPSRYLPQAPRRLVDDWPSVNLIVRREAFEAVGGFDTEFWPGEDTKFCLDLVRNTGGRILYLPEMLVWHHRRQGLAKHLRQVGNYGLHRGFFARHYPETSRRCKFFIPSLWLVFVLLGAFVLPCPLWDLGIALYALSLLVACLDIGRHEPLTVTLASLPYIVLTHLWYGWRFIRGWFTKDLKSSLGR